MKVLYLSYDGMTDFLGQSQVIPYLSGLSRLGHEIHIISCEKAAGLAHYGEHTGKILQEAGIGWSHIPFTNTPAGVSKIRDLFRLRHAALRKHLQTPFDIVHCRSYIAAFAGASLKKKFGVRFLFDMRGFWVDERVEGGIWNMNNPAYRIAYRFFKWKEKQFFQNADAVVSLTHKGTEIISHTFGQRISAKTVVIPCCADSGLFSPFSISKESQQNLRDALEISQAEIVLTYLGSTGTWYKTKEMLAFFSRLLEYYPDSKFLFITGDNPQEIQDMALREGIGPQFLKFVHAPRAMVPAYLSISHLSVFFIEPSFSKQASSPTKMAELMCMGIPVITNAGVGDMETYLTDTRLGLLVQDFSRAEYDRVIAQLPALFQVNILHRRKYAETHFGLETGVQRYHSIYQKLGKENKG